MHTVWLRGRCILSPYTLRHAEPFLPIQQLDHPEQIVQNRGLAIAQSCTTVRFASRLEGTVIHSGLIPRLSHNVILPALGGMGWFTRPLDLGLFCTSVNKHHLAGETRLCLTLKGAAT